MANSGSIAPRQRVAVVMLHEDHGEHLGGVHAHGAHDRLRADDAAAREQLAHFVLLALIQAELVQRSIVGREAAAPSTGSRGEVARGVAQADDELAVELPAVAQQAVRLNDVHTARRGERGQEVGKVRVVAGAAGNRRIVERACEAVGDDRLQ
jgi:hypothetical protein